ncbi:hypothetical protein Kpho02_24440 [Kitasatospora phosalacinea]|uniref:ABC transporter n=1 Tax=Kitasatospora phosalacinea TaxID=2065 RepID=A0A9W6V2L5_9ACTN|nr:hypothetical protein [Kitasatospora phosalacinea]GLW70145.1 hypothetical protein Kpho02_24440 [Kitasatospora phosalacinea]
MLSAPPRTAGTARKQSAGRLAVALLGPALRQTPRTPLLLGGSVALSTAALPAALGAGLGLSDAALLCRVGAVVVALAVGFALDDRAARTTGVLPVRPLLRRVVRAVPVLAVGAVVWTATAVLARAAAAPEVRSLFPWGGLATEAGALTVVALALAALGLRLTGGEQGGATAAPGVLLLVIAAALLPDRFAVFLPPGHPHWTGVHLLWAGLLGVFLTGGVLLARTDP